MKMGLGLVLVGHLNFLLGALVHGTVLRNVNVNLHTTTIEYAIANVIALAAGLVVRSDDSSMFSSHVLLVRSCTVVFGTVHYITTTSL